MLISIIIPVHNTRKFLSKCLESVKNQTYKELEIILVDDGSTDGSGLICDEYSLKDERFRVIHKNKKEGVSSARNDGLKAAKGAYIGFVDSDDWIDPCMYESLLQHLHEHEADISMCGYVQEPPSLSHRQLQINDYAVLNKLNRSQALNQILNQEGFQGYLWNKLFAADLLKREPRNWFDQDIQYGEDLIFCCNTFLKSNKIIYDPKPYYHYIIHGSNVSQSNFSAEKITLLRALERIITSLQSERNIEIEKYIDLYMHTNIRLLMFGIQENKCSQKEKSQLKKNLYRYKLSEMSRLSVKSSCFFLRQNINFFYLIWLTYKKSSSFWKQMIVGGNRQNNKVRA